MDEKRRLVKELRAKNREKPTKGDEKGGKNDASKDRKKDGKIWRLGEGIINDHSSLFTANFCDGAVEAVLMAYQGSDADILPPKVLQATLIADPNVSFVQLDRMRIYTTANKDGPPLSCKRVVKGNVLLRIRHGTNLSLRNMEWLISESDTEYVLISRKVLRAFSII